VIIEFSHFENCRGYTAGLLNFGLDTSLHIKRNCTFINNWSSSKGDGALRLYTADVIKIEDSTFDRNGIRDVYLWYTDVAIDNCSFSNGDKMFVYLWGTNIEIHNSVFSNITK